MRSASFFLGDVLTLMNFSEGIFFSLGGFKILPYIANRVEARILLKFTSYLDLVNKSIHPRWTSVG